MVQIDRRQMFAIYPDSTQVLQKQIIPKKQHCNYTDWKIWKKHYCDRFTPVQK